MADTWSVDALLKLTRRIARALSSRHDSDSRQLDASIFRLDRTLLDIRNNYPPTTPLLWIDDVGAALQSAYNHLNPPSNNRNDNQSTSSKSTKKTNNMSRSHADLRVFRKSQQHMQSDHDLSSRSLQASSRYGRNNSRSSASASQSRRPSLASIFSNATPSSKHTTKQSPTQESSNNSSLSTRFRNSVSRLFAFSSPPPPPVPVHILATATKTVEEWLAAVQAAREDNTLDDTQSWISLSDALPPLPQQYSPCRDNLYQCARDALITASLAVPDTASQPATRTNTVALVGPHGVGKTMLATELVHDVDLCNTFADGVAWIQLGADINDEELADQLINCVETIVSSDFRETCRYADSIFDIVERAQTLLSQVSSLVVIDDVSGPTAQRAFQLITSALGSSTVALYTCPVDYNPTVSNDDEMLLSDNITIVSKLFVKPLQPNSSEAKTIFRSWLTRTQSDQSRQGSLRHIKDQATIIQACHGLPLGLAMSAGFLSKFHSSWQFLATSLVGSLSGYDTVTRIMRILQTKGGPRFESQLREIACLPQGVWVSLSALADIWGMDYRTVKTSARRLGRMAFAEYRLGDSSDDSRVRFHWLILRFCRSIAAPADQKSAHCKLLSNICRRRTQHSKPRLKTDYMPWWNGCITDMYMCRRLHWHMLQAEAIKSLNQLICDYNWICHRLEKDGLLAVTQEIQLAALAEKKRGNMENATGMESILNAIEEAATMRYNEEMEASSMPTFLVSRLRSMEAGNNVCRQFLSSIYEKAKRPWLKPLPTAEALPPSSLIDSGSSDSMDSEDQASQSGHCLTSSSSGKVVCGDRHGNIQVFDAATGKNIVSWTGTNVVGPRHLRGVGALATVQDFVVSGHLNGQVFFRSIRSGRVEILQEASPTGDRISCIASTDAGVIAVGCKSGKVFVLRGVQELGCEYERIELEGHCDQVACLHVFAEGTRVASSSHDGFAAIWKLGDKMHERISLNGHKPEFGHKENYIRTFATISDDNLLLSSCQGGFVSAWSTENGECLWTERYGFQFSCSESLQAFGMKKTGAKGTDGGDSNLLNVGYPYLIARNKVPCELLIVAGGKTEILATITTEQIINNWLEMWHPSKERIYVAVSLVDGRLLSYELLTWLK